jgi:tRNA threonylcarbamoyladenosine biosynthesis protein TsaB
MKLLAMETSAEQGSVALALDDALTEREIPSPREQTRLLLPLIDELLHEAGLALKDLDAITFGRGPGSFTGLRVAAAAAQGMAMAADLPLLPVSSLAALAQGAWRSEQLERTLIGVDARMNEMYWAPYSVRDGLVELQGAERLSVPEQVAVSHTAPWAAIGNAFASYAGPLAAVLAGASVCRTGLVPRARDLIPLAQRLWAAGGALDATAAQPIYLREESAWRTVNP